MKGKRSALSQWTGEIKDIVGGFWKGNGPSHSRLKRSRGRSPHKKGGKRGKAPIKFPRGKGKCWQGGGGIIYPEKKRDVKDIDSRNQKGGWEAILPQGKIKMGRTNEQRREPGEFPGARFGEIKKQNALGNKNETGGVQKKNF